MSDCTEIQLISAICNILSTKIIESYRYMLTIL